MNFIDCTNLNASEREDMFGKGFADVVITGVCVEDGQMYTRIVIDGNTATLIGDPEQALHNYLLGKNLGRAQ